MSSMLTSIVISIMVFITLYVALVWVSFIYLYDLKQQKPRTYPDVTIAIPAYNEEKAIKKTILSALSLEYPKDKLKVVVINDGSKDRTRDVVLELKRSHHFEFIDKINEGKAKALNTALEACDTELFACLDADSHVDRDSLKLMIPHFNNDNVAATISAIKVDDSRNFYEKLQRMEYILAIMTRKLMSFINTLSVTPGVLSVYRTDVLKKIKGFDNKSLTEDFEIAMRLKYNGYDIEIETKAITYTTVPETFKKLWRQSVRWYRGFVESHIKYRKMFLNRKYGFLAYFQLPLNVIGILLLIGAIAFVSYGNISYIYHLVQRSLLINGFFLSQLLSFTKPKDLLLSQNFKIMIPIIFSLLLGIAIFYLAHKEVKEKIRFPFTIWSFFVILPLITALHWLGALGEEIFKIRKRW